MTTTQRLARWRSEHGVALVLSLLIMLTASILAASMMYLAQTETMASQNYRVMSQARYGAESGIHAAAHYLLNAYVPPAVGDPNYDITKSPVEFGGLPVVLSSNPATAANYPDAAVQTAFSNAVQGTLAAGNTSVRYNAYATMLSMQPVNGQSVLQWQITADGMVTNVRTATVEVSSILEKQVTATVQDIYAAFATGSGCGALQFSGESTTDSYDSTQPLGGGHDDHGCNEDGYDDEGHHHHDDQDHGSDPRLSCSSGNVGTNGNLRISGESDIFGSLSTPRVGVGTCSGGHVTGETPSGGAEVHGGVIQLSQAVTVPTPAVPAMPGAISLPAINEHTACPPELGSACHGTAGDLRLGPGSYNTALHLTNEATLRLTAGTYNFDSVSLNDDATIVIDSGPVTLNVVGAGSQGNNPVFSVNSSMVSITHAAGSFDPTQFVINYAGAGAVVWNNEATSVLQLNAPNAAVTVRSSEIYGSVIGNTISFQNEAHLHFDRHLASTGGITYQVGADMLTSFSWKKY